MAALCIVLDTNVLLSGIAYPGSIPGRIVAAWRGGSIDVVLSMWILDELRRVLPRLAHRHAMDTAEIDDLVDSLALQCELVAPLPSEEPLLRDAADGPVLGTLLAAAATGSMDYLVTGDKDLLVLADRYPILTPAAFWQTHGHME